MLDLLQLQYLPFDILGWGFGPWRQLAPLFALGVVALYPNLFYELGLDRLQRQERIQTPLSGLTLVLNHLCCAFV